MMRTDTPRKIYLKDYRPPDYLIDTVDLDIELGARETVVRSTLAVRRNPVAGKGLPPLVLDGEKLTLRALAVDGVALPKSAYRISASQMKIAAPPGKRFTVEIVTTCDPKANTELSGLYLSRNIFCTQCEAEGFRRITYYPDRPDVLAIFTVRIAGDLEHTPVLLSNGNPVDFGELDNGRHFVVWHDPFPKPSYLFALVGGKLGHVSDSFITESGRFVALNIYVEPGKEERCGYAMDALKRAMRWDEVSFGREYDLDIFNIVAVSDFNMGAMENKGLNIFNDKYILASAETATDTDYANIEAIIAHEYFHNWTGNRITCRDWFQLCLKEGLTVFRDQEFSSQMRSATVERIGDVKLLRSHQFAEDAGPLAHPVRPNSFIEINNFYTPTVYEKGAELVRMIRTITGEKGFRAGMDLYFKSHDGQAATVEDFIRCFESACGADLGQFRLWYSQAGTPELVAKSRHDARSGTFVLEFEQIVPPTPGQPRKRVMDIPVRLGLVGPDGADLPLVLESGEEVGGGILHIRKRREKFRFTGVKARPVPSLLRGFSAPVRVTSNASDEDLLFLLANDRDLFNRWQAANGYAMRYLTEACRALGTGKEPGNARAYAGALGAALGDDSLEPAFRALLIELPSEMDLHMAIGADVDPDRVRAAREWLRRELSSQLADQLEGIYHGQQPEGPYSPDAQAAGQRALRNGALALLAAPGDAAAAERIAAHYASADNMTDMSAALSLITHIDDPRRGDLLASFFDRFRADALVVDKWLALHAVSSLPGSARRIEALMKEDLFSLANPNRVRALIGSFALLNATGFHAADGSGYRLVADCVIAVDQINPQVAARLLGAFRNWRMMEPGRAKKAETELRRVTATSGLSRDVTEIARRSLDLES